QRVGLKVIHHSRKATAEDIFDAPSGTTGLTGAADTLWVMQKPRGKDIATLHVTGRDVEEEELALQWDPHVGGWLLKGPAEEHRLAESRRAALSVLHDTGRPMTPSEFAAAAGMNFSTAKTLLWRMARDGMASTEGGRYACCCNRCNPATGTP